MLGYNLVGVSVAPEIPHPIKIAMRVRRAGAVCPKPTLSAKCVGDKFVVESNDIPHYTFVQTTPNPLKGVDEQ